MGEALAILAAALFALGTVLQQKGALSTSAAEGDPRFVLQILRRPVWVAGVVLPSPRAGSCRRWRSNGLPWSSCSPSPRSAW